MRLGEELCGRVGQVTVEQVFFVLHPTTANFDHAKQHDLNFDYCMSSTIELS